MCMVDSHHLRTHLEAAESLEEPLAGNQCLLKQIEHSKKRDFSHLFKRCRHALPEYLKLDLCSIRPPQIPCCHPNNRKLCGASPEVMPLLLWQISCGDQDCLADYFSWVKVALSQEDFAGSRGVQLACGERSSCENWCEFHEILLGRPHWSQHKHPFLPLRVLDTVEDTLFHFGDAGPDPFIAYKDLAEFYLFRRGTNIILQFAGGKRLFCCFRAWLEGGGPVQYNLAMNLLGKLQSEYQQLWKHIIRPSRTAYSEDSLGPSSFRLEGQEVVRRDFTLTNSRGYSFAVSLWTPTLFDKCNCVLYLHGNAGNRTEGMEYLGKLVKHSLALCTFDFSGCGNADGEYVTLGYYQQEDLRLVVDQLKEIESVNHVALWGRSMGAVTSMLYLAKTIDVKAVVLDSPFKNLKTLIEDMAKRNSKVPSFVLAGAIKIISKTVQDKAGFSIYNVNPLKYSVPGLYCPAFFVVAIDDEIVPSEHTKQLFAAYAGEDKTLKMIKGKHNDSRPQDCINQTVTFLLERLGHDWKEGLKKPKKEFDFFQMEKQQELERQQYKKEEVDFFEQAQNMPLSEATQSEDKDKKEFSLSGLFSIFSWDKKKEKGAPQRKEEKKQPIRDGYEDTRAILSKKAPNDSTKMTLQQRKQKQEWQQRIRRQAIGQSNDSLPAQWAMFVI